MSKRLRKSSETVASLSHQLRTWRMLPRKLLPVWQRSDVMASPGSREEGHFPHHCESNCYLTGKGVIHKDHCLKKILSLNFLNALSTVPEADFTL
ncbi:hypothetical protein H671_8g19545 [Cricetulus griseus]|uniref:Uncharacterized protein n=1 Tax=Cricetulus griseus TaxID=10029 RepID=A0A061HVR5_CRIGR|nr:hypothetical protein H671_8g19545 [Cricetulus griseus]